mmetsp:Transcript_21657/g.56541  ORF Transcript_21657/g.56541 Transcript_21657/m.56541 type:complete len:259 (+) Transcript_21657:310-1086(+)|eukprot:CAMPEP_0182917172 /NCGR_PEP_ID=MMETSP0105_2-20130417/1366_1 /TAXON_ID=81532 ORGANISM="Acanthoeca-like sp., Strain 10tr" /NCGR_SAMPLE_ID=MMETSP0105_2 /ASSEMBLY_ACC=CAM_ASM_000205 /LENGTH=258 /DNA_ID=CAMNT_0025054161 /DNA_START=259 /DNA_END=1035 /DNA_ORIENTATION=+
MVDYSRFAKIDVSSSEDEEDRGPPGVYRVGDGESVTIPGRNVTINSGNSKPAKALAQAPAAAPAAVAVPAAAAAAPAAAPPVHTLNGGRGPGYVWAQDRATVTVYAFVPEKTKGSALAVETTREKLTVTLQGGGEPLLESSFFAEVVAPDEVEDLDWEMVSVPEPATEGGKGAGEGGGGRPRRAVRVTVEKAGVVRGVTMWWKAAFKGGPEIDVDAIPGRASTAAKTKKFRDAFAEAQAMFVAKMRDAEDNRVEVDLE